MDRRDFIRLSAMSGCAMAMPCAWATDEKMRYVCKGELHKDFHVSILDGVNYLIDNYGEDAARKVLERTGTGVYRQMHRKLVAGDTSELLEWWRYYMEREDGKFELEKHADGTATLTVHDCPALRHLEKRGVSGGKRVCWATRILNDAFCAGSPYEIVLDETDDFSCRQVLCKRKEVAL